MPASLRRGVAGLTAVTLVGAGLVVGVAAAQAAVAPSAALLVDEVYGGGGNANAVYPRDFVELYNPGNAAVDLSGWAVQYASSAGSTWQVTPLSGTVPAGASFLVGEAVGANASLPAFTADVSGAIPMSGTGGKVALTSSTTALTCASGCADVPEVVDLVGLGAERVQLRGQRAGSGDDERHVGRPDRARSHG